MGVLDPELLKEVARQCPGYNARATARALTRFYNACFKPFGLTAEQFSLMVGIAAAEGVTLVDLALSAGIDPTTLSRNVGNLETRGLVCAEGGRGRAGKRLSLTTVGHRLLADAFPAWNAAKTALAYKLGETRLRSTTEAMAELAEKASCM